MKKKESIHPCIYTRCVNYNKKYNRKIFTLLIFTLPNCAQYETGPDMFPYLSKYLNGINDVISEHIFMIWNGDNTTRDHIRQYYGKIVKVYNNV